MSSISQVLCQAVSIDYFIVHGGEDWAAMLNCEVILRLPPRRDVEPELFANVFYGIFIMFVATLLSRPIHTDYLQDLPSFCALYLLMLQVYLSNNPFSIALLRELVFH